ncbi:hypothetical protein JOM56_012581 [Amanita muscaria]
MSNVLANINQSPDMLQGMQEAASMPLTLTDTQIREVIGKAHHDLLFDSGNKVYQAIWKELHDMKTLNRDLLTFLRFKNVLHSFFNKPENFEEILCDLMHAESEERLLEFFNEAIDKTDNMTCSIWKENLIEGAAQGCVDVPAWYTKDGQRVAYSSLTGSRLVYSSRHDLKTT